MKSQSGQIVVEYVLLLTIAVTLAMIIVTQLIKRDTEDPANSGAVIQQWQSMQDAIGKDLQN
jgi:hypothetical protein